MKYALETDIQSSYVILKQNDMRIFIHPEDIQEVCKLLLGIKSKQEDYNSINFDKFWDVYPKKTSKQIAKKSWQKINPSEELAKTIIMAVEEQSATPQWQKDGGTYIPMPSTWLNQMKWEDSININIKISEIENEW